jgi:hypothetical protein
MRLRNGDTREYMSERHQCNPRRFRVVRPLKLRSAGHRYGFTLTGGQNLD